MPGTKAKKPSAAARLESTGTPPPTIEEIVKRTREAFEERLKSVEKWQAVAAPDAKKKLRG